MMQQSESCQSTLVTDHGAETSRTSISAIIPTIGRPESLRRLLESLVVQTVVPDEIIVADGSSDDATEQLLVEPQWAVKGLTIIRTVVQPPHAVRQREAAIELSQCEWLLMLDDDIMLDRDCVRQLVLAASSAKDIVGVCGTYTNHEWPCPRPLWRAYLAIGHRIRGREWQGRVIGPLLRFGFNPVPGTVCSVEWMGSGSSLISKRAYKGVGGFSSYFLYRCTMNEDIDLSLKLSRAGRLLFCPHARMEHHHEPGGRLTPDKVAEDDLVNRYFVMRHTQKRSILNAAGSVGVFVLIESASNIVGGILRRRLTHVWPLVVGRIRALRRIAMDTRSTQLKYDES